MISFGKSNVAVKGFGCADVLPWTYILGKLYVLLQPYIFYNYQTLMFEVIHSSEEEYAPQIQKNAEPEVIRG